MSNAENEASPPEGVQSQNEADQPVVTGFRERRRQAIENLSDEERAKFKKSNRTMIVGAIVLGIILLVLGVLAGQNIAKSRSESALANPAPIEIVHIQGSDT